MDAIFTSVRALPLLAACVMAAASYPPIPADLTTPVQQRIAINGPNGEFRTVKTTVVEFKDLLILLSTLSHFCRLEYLQTAPAILRAIWDLVQCPHFASVFDKLGYLSYLENTFERRHAHWPDSSHHILLQDCINKFQR